MGRPAGLTAAASSLSRQATLRLLLAVALSGLATIAAGVWIVRTAADAAAALQLSDASGYVARRAAQLEKRWEADAFALKTQIELAHLTDDVQLVAPRLTSFFTALGGVGQFSAAVIRDRDGAVLFRFPATLDTDGLLSGQAAWARDGATGTLYRALHQPLWMGKTGMGWMTLLRPLDHALLYQIAYPGTNLFVEWQGQVLASSLGSPGMDRGQALQARSDGGGEFSRVEWTAGAPGPGLIVDRSRVMPFEVGWVLVAGPVGSLVVGLLAWLLLSRWLRETVGRLQRVETAVNRFDNSPESSAASEAALAIETGSDEIALLARGTRSMMSGIARARSEEMRAQARLAELNASLEQRVEQRTRELAASRDAALEGSRAKEVFVANMSHELRTPMNGLLGALELVRTMPMGAEQRALLETAATSGEALLAVINDVLDFSKMNAGKLELVREPVRMRELAAAAVTLFSASARSKDLELRFEWDEALPEWASVDVVRLRQILLNLLGNAVKFTARGSVVLRAWRDDEGGTDCMVFEVADTGIGIAPGQLESVFDPFVQADASRRKLHGGTGLGLAISRRLAEAMGGNITARSRAGEGSSFRLRIPTLVAEAARRPALAESAPASVTQLSGRVLVVEDNVVNRIIATTMLARLGLEVIECGDGHEACQLVADTAPDAVLMDVMMPVMDGLSATREIRAREANEGRARVPIIALTASALRPDIDAALESGMDDHVAKPFSLQQIAQVLMRHLRVTT